MSDAQPPIMVGEFRDSQGQNWVMLVNLSLEKSTNVRLTTVKSYERIEAISAEDGRSLPWDVQNGHWLLAGHGLLIRFE